MYVPLFHILIVPDITFLKSTQNLHAEQRFVFKHDQKLT